MADQTMIGRSVPVHDAAAKVTGQLQYVDDISLPGMLYAKVLWSPVAHARIKSIDTAAAEQLPGVRAVACYKNTPQVRFNSTTRFFLQSPAPIETERVFDDTVRFVGDRVAAVAADTPEIARRAVELIRVEYEELPVLVDPLQALEEGTCPIHGSSNVALRLEKNAGDVEKGFLEADRIFEDTYTTPAVHHCAIEPHTAIASMDVRGKLTLIAPFQNTFGERIVLSRIWGMPLNKIRVVSPTMGGAFGGKMESSMELIPVALTMLCRRPVKLTLNRRECMVSTRCRHAAVIRIRTGVKNDGTLVAQDIHVVTNTGAYASSAANVIGAMSAKVFKAYKTPNMRFVGTPVYTNTPVAGAMRGYGSPQVYFAMECQLQRIAREMGLDYTQLQLQNLVDPEDSDLCVGHPIGNPRPKDCLERALELQKNWSPLSDENGKYRIGVGWALGVHGSGAFGSQIDQNCMVIKMNDVGSCVLHTGTHDMGNGALIAQMQVISEELGIPLDRIDCIASDTDVCGWNLGDFSSRGVYVSCYAVKEAAEDAARQLRREAAQLLGTEEADIRLRGGFAESLRLEKRVPLDQVMNHAQSVSHHEIFGVATHASEHVPGSYGVHMARVRVDTESGRAEVTDYIAVHDVGRVMNRMGIEGQLEGGIQMGIGYALQEALEYDEQGRLKRSSLHTYHTPTALEMPRLQTDFIEKGEPTGPYGAKSISECAVVPSAPAVINAISNALGRDLHDLPYRPVPESARILRLRTDESCIFCGLCARKCPQDAITVDRKERFWRVNDSRCVECGLCQSVCPKKCLHLDDGEE
jgi:CO/xanthine dehydrogenase Mo-binding subunit/Pyruvate/2-oxoacid:ferredoxin oxidoreductase delta subunit